MIVGGNLSLRWDGSDNWILERRRPPSGKGRATTKEEITEILGYYSTLEAASRSMLRHQVTELGGSAVIVDFLSAISAAEESITRAVLEASHD